MFGQQGFAMDVMVEEAKLVAQRTRGFTRQSSHHADYWFIDYPDDRTKGISLSLDTGDRYGIQIVVDFVINDTDLPTWRVNYRAERIADRIIEVWTYLQEVMEKYPHHKITVDDMETRVNEVLFKKSYNPKSTFQLEWDKRRENFRRWK